MTRAKKHFHRVQSVQAIMALVSFMSLAPVLASTASSQGNGEGETLYKAYCSSCHGMKGDGNKGVLAPAIAGLPKWYSSSQIKKFKSGLRGKHPQDTGGLKMVPNSKVITDDKYDLVLTYVSEMKPQKLNPTIVGNASKGEKLYAPCLACHGADGKGNQTLKAPPLVNQSDWYLKNQLHNFKNKVRGYSSQDMDGMSMASMAGTLIDDAAVDNVIDYILALQGERGK